MKNLVILSGGFDPIHIGHVAMFQDATKHGDIVVCLNSDEWIITKKGKQFMNWNERAAIVLNMKGVIGVIEMFDDDGTACAGIERAYLRYKDSYDKVYFGNGGDRNPLSTPSKEQVICEKLGIGLIWNVGGGTKPQSSSWILNKWSGTKEKEVVKPWGKFRTIKEGINYKVKEIIINSHQRISYQYHNFRSELWMIVSGNVSITKDGVAHDFTAGGHIYIPVGYQHRIENIGDTQAVIIEIQFGEKCAEDDIVRLEDDYNRIK